MGWHLQMKGFRVPTDAVRDVSKWSFGNSPSDSTEKGAVEHTDLLTACLGQSWWASLVPNQVNLMGITPRRRSHEWGGQNEARGWKRNRWVLHKSVSAWSTDAGIRYETPETSWIPQTVFMGMSSSFLGFCFVLLKSVCHILHISLFRNFWFQKIK